MKLTVHEVGQDNLGVCFLGIFLLGISVVANMICRWLYICQYLVVRQRNAKGVWNDDNDPTWLFGRRICDVALQTVYPLEAALGFAAVQRAGSTALPERHGL